MFEPYYDKPRFKLYLADCLAVLAEIEENSVDMVFADPPYFLSSGSFTCQLRCNVKNGHQTFYATSTPE